MVDRSDVRDDPGLWCDYDFRVRRLQSPSGVVSSVDFRVCQ